MSFLMSLNPNVDYHVLGTQKFGLSVKHHLFALLFFLSFCIYFWHFISKFFSVNCRKNFKSLVFCPFFPIRLFCFDDTISLQLIFPLFFFSAKKIFKNRVFL